MVESKTQSTETHYYANYRNFQTELYAQIRREAYGEDIGQNSWLTAPEIDGSLRWLELSEGKFLLDVACGAGGPALRIALATGCSVVGVDNHEQAVTTANLLTSERGLVPRAEFRAIDASRRLPFPDRTFDAITCFDAINHFPNRPRLIIEWTRLLKPGGRLLFTDPLTVTGALTNAEIEVRSSAGFYLFVPYGYDEKAIAQAGLQLLVCEDVTANMADVAEGRRVARAMRSPALREIEGDETFNRQQEFLTTAANIAREGRLSRFLYVAKKPIE